MSVTEVRGEEVSEARGSRSGGFVVVSLDGVGRSEEHGGLNLESLEIGMLELTGGVNPSSLEGVTSNVGGMSVI